MNTGKEVWIGEVEGFPMFFKKGEEIISIPCFEVDLMTKGHDEQIDSLVIEFGLALPIIKELNEHIDFFSGIDYPEHENGFFIDVRFRIHANESVCKQLYEDYTNGKGKTPIDILLQREIPNVPYYRKIINYEIMEWKAIKTAW